MTKNKKGPTSRAAARRAKRLKQYSKGKGILQPTRQNNNFNVIDFVVNEADQNRAARIVSSTNYYRLANSVSDVERFYALEMAMAANALKSAGIPFEIEHCSVTMNPDDLVNDWNRGRIKKMALAD